MSDSITAEISKKVRVIGQNGSVLEEKELTVRGKTQVGCLAVFERLWAVEDFKK